MYAIVCVDNRMGMAFNHRRQSRDQALTEYLLNLAGDKGIRIHPNSGKLFSENSNVYMGEDYIQTAPKESFCFIEAEPLLPLADQIDALILCHWNRDYPGDLFLDLDRKDWRLQFAEEFPGTSHEKITVEVYVK